MQFSKWVTLLFSSLCLMAVAGILRQPHLYYMAAILLTLPGVSYLLGWFALRGLEFEREMPQMAWEGEESRLHYIVRNPSRIARFFLSIQETLPAWVEMADEEPQLFNVSADDVAGVTQKVRFLRRGVFAANGFDVTAMDPLGVFAFTRHIPCEGELVVYPMPQVMNTNALSGAERHGWQEFTSRLLRGSSVDPDGVRPYVPGDSMRRIHWRQTARTGKLSVIEFEETLASNLVIALDLEDGSVVGDEQDNTLEYAVRIAASLAQEAADQGATVRLMLPPSQTFAPTIAAFDGRGQSHLLLILDTLARVEATIKTPMREWLVEQAASIRSGTTLAVVTAKPDPGLTDAFAPYLGVGVKVGMVFVDPNSFRAMSNAQQIEKSRYFLAAMTTLHLPTYVVRHEEKGLLNPEEFVYG